MFVESAAGFPIARLYAVYAYTIINRLAAA